MYGIVLMILKPSSNVLTGLLSLKFKQLKTRPSGHAVMFAPTNQYLEICEEIFHIA
jgi:hypothetical protein